MVEYCKECHLPPALCVCSLDYHLKPIKDEWMDYIKKMEKIE